MLKRVFFLELLLIILLSYPVLSDVLTLQEFGSESLGDTTLYGSAKDFDDWDSLVLRLQNHYFANNDHYIMLKFKITDIPAAVTITNAELCLNISSNLLDASEGYNGSTHHVYSSFVWDHITMTWNNGPTSGTEYNATYTDSYKFSNSDSVGTWICWDVTDMAVIDYGESSDNLSILIKATNRYGYPMSDWVAFHSVNATSQTGKPVLNITYESAGDSTPPVFDHVLENFTIYNTTAFAYDINATDDVEMSGFSVNDSNFKINSSGYLENNTILAVGYYGINITINDTSNNQNSSVMYVNVTISSEDPCIPSIDQTWTIETDLICENYDIRIGSGILNITTGSLNLVDSNFSGSSFEIHAVGSGVKLNLTYTGLDTFFNTTG